MSASQIVERLGAWLKNVRAAHAAKLELASCPAADLERMAHEIGMNSSSDFLAAVARGPEGTALVKDVATFLKLDLAAIEAHEPGSLRRLEIACNACENKGQCSHDLASERVGRILEYCPNRDELKRY